MTTQYLTIIGPPMIATFLSGWLRDAKIPKWLDTIIAFLVVLITAFIWALIAGKLVGDLPADTVVIAAYIAALIAGPMAALHAYLVVSLSSPFSAIIEALRPFEPEQEPPATVAPRISLPTTPQLIQRSSLLPNGQAWITAPIVPPEQSLVTAGSQVPVSAVSTTPNQGTQAAPCVGTEKGDSQ